MFFTVLPSSTMVMELFRDLKFQKDVCSSLLLSILKQTLEDKEESVRESAIRNITLVVTQITNYDKVNDVSTVQFTVYSVQCAVFELIF